MSGLSISNFLKVDPPFKLSRNQANKFITELHEISSRADHAKLGVSKLIERYSVKEKYVQQRNIECGDHALPNSSRLIYKIDDANPSGAHLGARSQFYKSRVEKILDQLFIESMVPPSHLIHVTCTGYIAPSPIQNLVGQRKWASTCTNAYHMGCFAALPAIRIAMGQVQAFRGNAQVVHTEMCSLHMDPSQTTPEQIVVQTLFADGHIKYEVAKDSKGARFEILSIKEKVLPESQALMSWVPTQWGFAMGLSRDVPLKITEALRTFVGELIASSGQAPNIIEEAKFAVHPGGPKIIDSVAEQLGLRESQIAESREILLNRGNMSSATLPHIWQKMLESDAPAGTPVVSLAFGPGLTIFGSVFLVQR